MHIFSLPRLIYYGLDSIDMIKELLTNMKWNRILVITDKTMRDLGALDRVLKVLNEFTVKVYDEVEPEPYFETAEDASILAIEFKPNVIIALGGGSVIDVAKAVWVKYERPDYDLHSISPFEWIGVGRKCQLIAIPTTSGTGSDATLGIVLSEKVKVGKRKIALGSLEVVPYATILDPNFPKSMPRKLTVSTGVDALAHSIEALVSTEATDFTDALALKSIEIIFVHLPRVLEDPENLDSRTKIHLAATMAGIAFSNSGLGIAHAIAHAVGPVAKLPHGTMVGIVLPYAVKFNYEDESARLKYDILLRYLNSMIDVKAKDIIDALLNFYDIIGQAKNVREAGGDVEKVKANIEKVVADTLQDPDLAFNPRFCSEEDIKDIIDELLE